jgi:hypothetical protein
MPLGRWAVFLGEVSDGALYLLNFAADGFTFAQL